MQKAIILTEEEWRRLPMLIADALHKQSRHFDVVFHDSGEKLDDRAEDWWRGTMALAFMQAVEKLKD